MLFLVFITVANTSHFVNDFENKLHTDQCAVTPSSYEIQQTFWGLESLTRSLPCVSFSLQKKTLSAVPVRKKVSEIFHHQFQGGWRTVALAFKQQLQREQL